MNTKFTPKFPAAFLALLLISSQNVPECTASKAAANLLNYIMMDYLALVLPQKNHTDVVTIHVGVKLSQLIDIDESNQRMIISVWVQQKWYDYRLKWDPKEHGGIDRLSVPVDMLWRPDITLYNTADGEYDVFIKNYAMVYYDGWVAWNPPAVYTSLCQINSQDFPFDEQRCFLKFGSWAYTQQYIDLEPLAKQTDLSDYRENGEWQIVETPVSRTVSRYPCCPDVYVELNYTFVTHRNAMFYIITLVIPCILISFMCCLVFYHPTDEQERITLCITILMSVAFFLLLIPGLVPPTSDGIPLIGKYTLFTLVVSSISVFCTVLNIHVHYRTQNTHVMPRWMKSFFFVYLPRVFPYLKRPYFKKDLENYQQSRKTNRMHARLKNNSYLRMSGPCSPGPHQAKINKRFGKYAAKYLIRSLSPSLLEEVKARETGMDNDNIVMNNSVSPEYYQIVKSVKIIANHMRKEGIEDQVAEDWQYIALVLDRIMFWIFFVVCTVGTLFIFVPAKTFWENDGTHETPSVVRANIQTEIDYAAEELLYY